MVYGYKRNKTFIDRSQKLLERLEKKGLWNKDTLVVGLDRSVRPLLYTMRKLSKEEGKETPSIKFFYYSWRSMKGNANDFAEDMKRRVNPEKIEHYKNILLLDEHLYCGETLRNTKEILENYFSNSKSSPEISMAALGLLHPTNNNTLQDKKSFIYLPGEAVGMSSDEDVGVDFKEEVSSEDRGRIRIPKPLEGFDYKKYFKKRKELSKDIEEYIADKYPSIAEEKNFRRKNLEKKVSSGVFISLILSGLFLYGSTLTGYSIGSNSGSNFYGLFLAVFGIVGLIITQFFGKNKKV